jgi:hypothetical protein
LRCQVGFSAVPFDRRRTFLNDHFFPFPMRLAQPQRGRKPRFVVLGEPISGNTRYYGSLTVIPHLSSALCAFFIFFFVGDQTCQLLVNDSVRDWQWFGLDGIT